MKRSATALASAILIFAMAAAPGAAAAPIRLFVDGREIAADTPPQIVEGRTLVPVRAVAEALGASVKWDPATQTVTIAGSHSVSLTIGKASAGVDGRAVGLDVPAQIIGSRTFVPVRFVGEAFGYSVAWDGATPAVKLTGKTPAPPPTVPGNAVPRICWNRGEPELAGHTDFPTVYSYKLSGSTLTAVDNGSVGTYRNPETGRPTVNRTNPGPRLTTTLSWEGVPASYCVGDTLSIKLKAGGDGGVFTTADMRISDHVPVSNLLKSTKIPPSWVGHPGTTLEPRISLLTGKYVQEPSQTYTLKLGPKDTYADPPAQFRLVMYANMGTRFEVAVSWVYTPGEVDPINPVVFLPGILGSQLMALDGHILWPPGGPGANLLLEPVHDDFVKLSLDPARGPHQAIVPTDVVRNNGSDQYYGPMLNYLASTGLYREYQVNGDPRRRTTAGCDLTQKEQKPKLFVMAYDWRMSNADTARALKEYVGCVQRFYPEKKVDIVAHSMGGLAARRFILDNPDKVEKLITVATPWLGSPKPLYQMILGTTGTAWTDFAVALGYSEELKNMLEYYPSVHELMPSPSYFALGGRPYSKQPYAGAEIELEQYGDVSRTVAAMFPRPSYNGGTPTQNNLAFHIYNANGNAQDDWRNDTTGVRYYHLVGVQPAGDSPLTLREWHEEWTVGYNFSKKGPGDGTVPRFSAERKGPGGVNLNAPNATVITLEGGSDEGLLEHTGLMTNPTVMTKVLEFLLAK